MAASGAAAGAAGAAGASGAVGGGGDSPYLHIGDTVFFTLGTFAPRLNGFLTVISGTQCVVENQDHERFKPPGSAFSGNLWTVVEKLSDVEKRREADESGEGDGQRVTEIARGAAVTYGQTVQIRHTLTGMYLCLRRGRLERNTGELEAHLSSPRDATHFQIMPGSRAREKGKRVQIGDSFYFLHAALRYSIKNVPRYELDQEGRTVLIGSSTGSLWRIHRYAVGTLTSLLAVGDVFAIHHVNAGGFLSLFSEPGDVPPLNPYLRVSGAPGMRVADYWVVEGAQTYVGGAVRWHEAVRLKHLLSGHFLAARREGWDKAAAAAAAAAGGGSDAESDAGSEASGRGMGGRLLDFGGDLVSGRLTDKLVGGVGDAIKGTFSLEKSAAVDGAAAVDDGIPIVLCLVEEPEDDALWVPVPTDTTLDATQPIGRQQIIRLQHRETRLFAHATGLPWTPSHADIEHSAARTPGTPGGGVGGGGGGGGGPDDDDGAVGPADVVPVMPGAKRPPGSRVVHMERDEAMDDMWTLSLMPRDRVCAFYGTAAHMGRIAECVEHGWARFLPTVHLVRSHVVALVAALIAASAGRGVGGERGIADEGAAIVAAEERRVGSTGERGVHFAADGGGGAPAAHVLAELRARTQATLLAQGAADVIVKLLALLFDTPESAVYAAPLDLLRGARRPRTRGEREQQRREREEQEAEFMRGPTIPPERRAAYDELMGLARAAFFVLRLLVDSNELTAMGVWNHREFLLSLVQRSREDAGCMRTLIGMAQASTALCDHQRAPEIALWVQMCHVRPDLRGGTFSLLATLCRTYWAAADRDGVDMSERRVALKGLARVQRLISSVLFAAENARLLTKLGAEQADSVEVYIEKDNNKVCDLAELCTVSEESNKELHMLRTHHCMLMDLLAALCLGQNPCSDVRFLYTLPVIMRILEYDVLPDVEGLDAVAYGSALDEVKMRTLDIVCNAYIATDTAVGFRVELTRYWEEETIRKREKGGPPRDPQLETIRDWLAEYFASVSRMPMRHRSQFQLLCSALRAKLSLLSYNQDHEALQEGQPLEETLQSLQGILLQPLPDSVRRDDPDVEHLFSRAKHWICRVLLKVEDVLMDERVSRFFIIFWLMAKREEVPNTDALMLDFSLDRILGDWAETCNALLRDGDFSLAKLALTLLVRRHHLVHDTLSMLDQLTILHGDAISDLHNKYTTCLATLTTNSASEKRLIGNRNLVNDAIGQLILSIVNESLVTDPLKIEGAVSREAQDLLRRFEMEKAAYRLLVMPYQAILHPTFLRCYRFLRFFVRGNRENQNLLIPYISLMQSHMGRNLQIARLFEELLRDNFDLVSGLTEEQVLFFCNLLLQDRFPRYARLLHSLCIVCGLAVKRNQLIVANFLRSHRAETLVLYLTDDDRIRRAQLVAEDERQHDEMGELAYHETLIDLLGATCFKRNEACQGICRTLFPFADVLAALVDPAWPEQFKGSYWRFLQNAYLDTEASTLAVGERASLLTLATELDRALSEVAASKMRIAYVRDIRDNILPTLGHFLSTFVNVEQAKPLPGMRMIAATQQSVEVDVDSVDWMRNLVAGVWNLVISMAESTLRLNREMNFPELKSAFATALDRLRRSADIIDMADDLVAELEETSASSAMAATTDAAEEEEDVLVTEWLLYRKRLYDWYQYDSDLNDVKLTDVVAAMDNENLRKVVTAPLSDTQDHEFVLFVLRAMQAVVTYNKRELLKLRVSNRRRSSLSLGREAQDKSKGAIVRRKTLLGKVTYETPGAKTREVALEDGGDMVEEDLAAEELARIEESRRRPWNRLKAIFRRCCPQRRSAAAESADAARAARAEMAAAAEEQAARISGGRLRPDAGEQSRIDRLGGTHSAIVLLASAHPRVVLDALQALFLLLDAGNRDVQRTVLHAINAGLGSISPALADFQLLAEMEETFRECIEEAKSSPWWLRMGGEWKDEEEDDVVRPFDLLQVSIKVVKQLCEGHNLESQNLLREQQRSSVNIIQALVQYIDALVPPFIPNPTTSPLLSTVSSVDDISEVVERLYSPLSLALDTLIEVVQGPCVGNQRIIMDGLGIETLRSIIALKSTLEIAWDERKPDRDLVRAVHATGEERAMFTTATVLLIALLEGPEFWTHIAVMNQKELMGPLITRINAYGDLMQKLHTKHRAEFEMLLEEALPVFILLRYLAMDPALSPAQRALRGVRTPESFASRVGRIEIIRDERVEPYIFPKDELSELVTKKDHDRILWTVDRSTPAEKIEDFQEITEDLYRTLKVRRTVLSSRVKRTLTGPLVARLSRLVFNILIVCINTFYLVAGATSESVVRLTLTSIAEVLGYTVVGLVAMRWLAFEVLDARITAETRHRAAVRERQRTAAAAGLPVEPLGKWRNLVLYSWHKYFDRWYVYHLAMIAAAALGVRWGEVMPETATHYWFALHIIDILIQSPVLVNVSRAVTKNWRSLALTILLIVLLVYFFAIVAFLFFRHHFFKDYENRADDPTLVCTSVFMCWVTIFAQLPSQGDYLRERLTTDPSDTGFVWQFVFQLGFFFLVMVITINILLGIIIDTFSELREARNEVLSDMHGRCFICGLEASVFERDAAGFETHAKTEHNMWQYLHCYVHIYEKLEQEGETEFDGDESYLLGLYSAQPTDTRFYPQSRALVLQSAVQRTRREDRKVDVEALFQGVASEMSRLSRGIAALDKSLVDREAALAAVGTQIAQMLEDEDDADATAVQDAAAAPAAGAR